MSGGNYKTEHSGETAITLSSTNSWIFRPVQPVTIIRWGWIVTTAFTAGTALVMTGNHRQAGSAALTPSGSGDVGTVTNAATTQAVGLGTYTEVVSPNKTGFTRQPFLVLPGEEVQFVSGGQPNAGAGVIWVHYQELNFQDDIVDPNMRTATLTSPIADSSRLANYTEVSS